MLVKLVVNGLETESVETRVANGLKLECAACIGAVLEPTSAIRLCV